MHSFGFGFGALGLSQTGGALSFDCLEIVGVLLLGKRCVVYVVRACLCFKSLHKLWSLVSSYVCRRRWVQQACSSCQGSRF